jgi:hypothetical protein
LPNEAVSPLEMQRRPAHAAKVAFIESLGAGFDASVSKAENTVYIDRSIKTAKVDTLVASAEGHDRSGLRSRFQSRCIVKLNQ